MAVSVDPAHGARLFENTNFGLAHPLFSIFLHPCPDMVYRDPTGHFRPHSGCKNFSGVGVADRAHFWRFSVKKRYKFSDFTMMISGENHVGNQIFSPLALKMKPGEFFKHSRLKLISAIARNPFLAKRRLRKTYLLLHFLSFLLETFRIPQKYNFWLKLL